MGYAPAAARRALEATGSVEAAISALDPGYCAAVDTQQARGNAGRRGASSGANSSGGATCSSGANTSSGA